MTTGGGAFILEDPSFTLQKKKYRECVLAVRELSGKHDGESMASILLEIIEEFKLQAKVSLFVFVF